MHYILAGLSKKNSAEWLEAFKKLPVDARSLDLSENELFRRSSMELIEAFKLLPVGLTSLGLNLNSLNRKSGSELAQIFKALPVSLKTLDLSDNLLGFMTLTELIQALNALPANIRALDLRCNGLDSLLIDTELAEILPITLTSVTLDTRNIDLAAFRYKQTFQAKQNLEVNHKQQELQTQKEKILTRLQSQLLILDDKIKELEVRNNCNEAYNAAINLRTTLTELKNQFAMGIIDYPSFQMSSLRAIKTARTELEIHRGWKEILGNIALCILGLGIGYLTLCAYNEGFFKFNTDSATKLDALQNTIITSAPAA